MIELPTIPGYGNGVGSFGSSRYLPSLDLAFAEDKAFTVNTASPGNALITSRKGPSANFLRQSGATYINDQGLIEYAPENLVTQSENPSSGNWYKTGSVYVYSTTDPTPTGSLNAYLINATSSSDGIIASDGGQPVGASIVTGSVWLKASNPTPFNTFISFRNEYGSLILEQSITITSEWQRFSITGNIDGYTIVRVGVGGNGTFSYGKSFYIWGAQIERHSSARTYLPTTTSPFYGPRFDHDPLTKVCKGLFIEESRSNLISFSEAIGNSAWNTFASATAIDNQTTSPRITALASRITATAGTSTMRTRVRIITITSGGTSYSSSMFIKTGTSNFGVVTMAFNKSGTGGIRSCEAHIIFSTGVITKTGISNTDFTVTSKPYPNGWYRIEISGTSNANLLTENQVVIGVGLSFNGTGTSGSFTGTESVFAWGAQLEVGSTPSSYIPTTNGTVLRSADISSISNTSSFWNSSQFTLFTHANFATPNSNTFSASFYLLAGQQRFFSHHRDSNNTVIAMFRQGSFKPDITLEILATGEAKIISTHITGQQSACMNGNAVQTQTSDYIPTANPPLFIGYSGVAGGIINGHIARVTYYPRRIPNHKLQALTTL